MLCRCAHIACAAVPHRPRSCLDHRCASTAHSSSVKARCGFGGKKIGGGVTSMCRRTRSVCACACVCVCACVRWGEGRRASSMKGKGVGLYRTLVVVQPHTHTHTHTHTHSRTLPKKQTMNCACAAECARDVLAVDEGRRCRAALSHQKSQGEQNAHSRGKRWT